VFVWANIQIPLLFMNVLAQFGIVFLVFFNSWFDNDRLGKFTRIARKNQTIARAEDALKSKRYQAAIREYTKLENEFGHKSDYLSMNFAHAHYLNGQPEKALPHYQKITQSLDYNLASEANRMVGKIAEQKGEFETAEEAYKKALLKNPRNQTARHNLLQLRKRKPEPPPQTKQQEQKKQDQQKEKQASSDYGNKNEQPNSQQKNQNSEGDKTDQKPDDNQAAKGKDQKGSDKQKAERDAKGGQKSDSGDEQDVEGKEKERSENEKDKKDKNLPLSFNQGEGDYQVSKEELKKMNLSPEKAKAMLESMRNAEVQYLQQKQLKNIFKAKGGNQNW